MDKSHSQSNLVSENSDPNKSSGISVTMPEIVYIPQSNPLPQYDNPEDDKEP